MSKKVTAPMVRARKVRSGSASGEQAKGNEELTQFVARMDGATQQNASFAEESAASAASLAERTRALSDLVSSFQLSDGSNSARSCRPLTQLVA